VKYVIGLPKTANTRYALIDYHNGSKMLIDFDDFKDKSKLKEQVNLITWQGNGDDFENLLLKAKDLFQMSRKARKVFMIFVNDRLNADLNVIRSSVRMLNSLGVKVIVVRIGDRVNDQEISALTSSTVVRSRTTDVVARIGDIVGTATLKGSSSLFIFPGESREIFTFVIPQKYYYHLIYLNELPRILLDTCAAVRCPFHGQCIANVDNSYRCECPDSNSCPPEKAPVCGTYGRTYINACFMRVFSCRNKVKVNVKHQGACGKIITYFHL
jgi:hypothetical protein